MKRLLASKTFVQNEAEVLAIAQTAERFGQRPSKLLNIKDKVLAVDFDTICSYRLILLDLERAIAEKEALENNN